MSGDIQPARAIDTIQVSYVSWTSEFARHAELERAGLSQDPAAYSAGACRVITGCIMPRLRIMHKAPTVARRRGVGPFGNEI